MTLPPATLRTVSALLLGACALAPGAAPALAQGFEDTACQAFEGHEDCRTVTIVDRDSCIVKIRPAPLPDLDPAIAGCLIDDIGTRQVFLANAAATDIAVADDAGAADETGAGAAGGTDAAAAGGTDAMTTVLLSGAGVVQILTAYDENGAPVWETRDSGTFAHAGDPGETRRALERLSSEFCGRRGPAPVAAVAEGDAGAAPIPRVVGVEEAYRLSEAGRIVLIDVRLESEWRATGIAATAIPVTMHQRGADFVRRITEAAGADGRTPVALICATGQRSAYLQRALRNYGFDGIIDVRGGMLGGKGAPGWIESGLPVKPYEPQPGIRKSATAPPGR